MFEVGDEFPRVLWVYAYMQYGCDACAAARPALEQLRRKYPLKIIIVELHIDQHEWTELLDWTPKYTPGYALVERNGAEKKLIKKTTGTMDFKQLEQWIGSELLS